MSVLIKMEMPKSCHECPLLYVTSLCDGFKPCPIVPVPPHGRLIDADAAITLIQEDKIEGETLGIMKALGSGLQAETLNQACDRHIKIINSLPTIIEAEDGE